MEGLDTFSAYVNQIRIGAENGGSSAQWFNRPNGTLILAKTNLISCTGTPGLRLVRVQSNGGTAIVKLGQENTILSDSGIEVGGRKSVNSQLIFNSGLPSPTALFRDLAGTGRQSLWTIADGIEQTTSSGSPTTATANFTGGTVDALVETIIVGRAGGGTGTGTLTFDAGIVDVNTLYLGVETFSPTNGTGTVNVNGTGQLLVNGDLVLGSGGTGGSATHGVLTIGSISGGAVAIGGNVVCAGGVGNVITSSGDLTFGGQVGASGDATNTPLETLNLGSGTVTFDLGAAGNPAIPRACVTNFNVNGTVALNVKGLNLSFGQFSLINHLSGAVGGSSGFAGLALVLPDQVEGYLSNNTANASVDVVITNINNAPIAAADFNLGVPSYGSATIEVLAKYVTDADVGDTLTITNISSPNATISGGNIVYTNTSGTDDSFTYTVSDGLTTATGMVTVTTHSSQGFNKLSGPVDNGNGTLTLNYLGVPDENYALETTANLTPPMWVAIQTNAAAGNGALSFTFPTGDSQGFFRTRHLSP